MDSCARCERLDNLKICSTCRSVKYCSKECQVADWKTHKIICRKSLSNRPTADFPRQQDSTHGRLVQQDTIESGPTRQRQITSLYMSRIDLSLRDGRWLQYFSDDLGLSELDLSKYIGNDDGKLVWGSTGYHLTTARATLTNGHVLAAKLYRTDGSTLVESWINLDTYIHCDDEVLLYDPERAQLGEIIWPWTMKDYHVREPPRESAHMQTSLDSQPPSRGCWVM